MGTHSYMCICRYFGFACMISNSPTKSQFPLDAQIYRKLHKIYTCIYLSRFHMHILTISVFSTLYIPNAPVQRNATLLCIARIYKKKNITNLDQKPPFQCMLLKPKCSFVKLNVN